MNQEGRMSIILITVTAIALVALGAGITSALRLDKLEPQVSLLDSKMPELRAQCIVEIEEVTYDVEEPREEKIDCPDMCNYMESCLKYNPEPEKFCIPMESDNAVTANDEYDECLVNVCNEGWSKTLQIKAKVIKHTETYCTRVSYEFYKEQEVYERVSVVDEEIELR